MISDGKLSPAGGEGPQVRNAPLSSFNQRRASGQQTAPILLHPKLKVSCHRGPSAAYRSRPLIPATGGQTKCGQWKIPGQLLTGERLVSPSAL